MKNTQTEWFDSSSAAERVIDACGGKAAGLHKLTSTGMPVPPWKALSWQACSEYLAESPAGQVVQDALRGWPEIEPLAVSQAISAAMQHPLTDTQRQRWLPADIPAGGWAIRSSARAEDSADHSFAGQHASCLDLTDSDAMEHALREVWASTWSERALTYRLHNGMEPERDGPGVVFQHQVRSEWSGVMFTCDPIQKHSAHWLIHAIRGLGEAYVSGAVPAEEFHLHPDTGTCLHHIPASQDDWIPHASAGLIPLDAADKKALPESALQALWQGARQWQQAHPGAWDLEWAVSGDKAWFVQARRVTTFVEKPSARWLLWDNSNIVESYGGLTLPLTFSFASRMYHAVYVQFCKVLGLEESGLKQMEPTLRNMLGLIDGRVYYNLFHWYRLTGLLPFYKANRSFMETMMGTSRALSSDIADAVRPPVSRTSGEKLRHFWSGVRFLQCHFTIQSKVDDFLAWFNHHYSKCVEFPVDQMDAAEALSSYEFVEDHFAHSWQTPIINDYLCMVHFGLFKALCTRWMPAMPTLHNDLLAGSGNLESAEPTRVLLALAAKVRDHGSLSAWIETHDDEACAQRFITQRDASDEEGTWLSEAAKDYLKKYGFRCMSEMKLEQSDLWEKPAMLFGFLRNLLHARTISVEAMEIREHALRDEAEQVVRTRWKRGDFGRRILFNWSLFHTRKAVRNRENTRFCRTRIYGIARRLFNRIGVDLAARDHLDSPKDVFYLELEEIRSTIEGTATTKDLRALVASRKQQYHDWSLTELPKRFSTWGPVAWSARVDADPLVDQKLKPGELLGQGCCPGVVEGIVKVVLEPEDDLRLQGEILVTRRTDPGWIPLYPAVSALLVERGGLLSHSAIVAREMGLPTIVNIPNLIKTLRSGMRIRIDGQSGRVQILDLEEGEKD